jgi:hypothetical protein
VKESQAAKETCRRYTIGKGPISIGDKRKSVANKVARRKPKKQQLQVETQTQFIMSVCDKEEGEDINSFIDPELRGITLGDPVQDPFAEQDDYIRF